MPPDAGLPRAPFPDHRANRQPRPSRWPWVVAGTVVTVTLGSILGTWLWGFWMYASHDRLELIENQRFLGAVERPCSQLQHVARERTVVGSSRERADALSAISAAGRAIPDALSAFDPADLATDHPTAGWAADWTVLLDAVDAHSSQLRSGNLAPFAMPETEDGYTIVGRMNLAAGSDCEVPSSLATLDPSPPPDPESW